MRDRPIPRAQAGFTLAELLVVLAIIGLLTTLVVINVLPMQDRARVSKARADLATVEQALELFRLDAGRYPTTEEGLAALAAPGTAAGPMLKRLPRDPWDRAYQYQSPAAAAPYALWSWGADGQRGGEGLAADVTADMTGSAEARAG